jgi:hypothetical protein
MEVLNQDSLLDIKFPISPGASTKDYLRDLKGRENELTQKKIAFWEITERARRFVKADKIAYRLGLVNRIVKEVEVMRVRVLQDGIPILGNYTYPHKGVEVEISEDEWMSEDVQRFVRENKIESVRPLRFTSWPASTLSGSHRGSTVESLAVDHPSIEYR